MDPYIQILEDMNSPNVIVQTAAIDSLEKAIATEFQSVVLALSHIMVDEQLGAAVWIQAALQMRKVDYSPDIKCMDHYKTRWLELPKHIRAQINTYFWRALDLVDLELDDGYWPDVMAQMVVSITEEVATKEVATLNQASLVAICYIYIDMKLDGILDIEQNEMSAQDRSQLAKYQSMLCGALESVLHKMDRADAQNIADQIMSVLMVMFERAEFVVRRWTLTEYKDSLHRYSVVMEDALLAVNAFIDVMGPSFSKYSKNLVPILIACLQIYFAQTVWWTSRSHVLICSLAVGILGDLARQVAPQLDEYLEEVFRLLFTIFDYRRTDRSLLPQIISAFGDFARFLGDSFAQYRDEVIETLIRACQAEVNVKDDLDILRQSYIGTFVVLIQVATANIERPHMKSIIKFMEQIGAQQFSSDKLIGKCCGLVGDIANKFGMDSLEFLDTDSIKTLLNRGRDCQNDKAKKNAAWAIRKWNELRGV